MTFSLPPDSPDLHEVVHFVVPKEAADALDVSAIVAAAQRRGVQMRQIEMNDPGEEGGRTRITCRVVMAILLTQAWTSIAEHAPDTDEGHALIRSLSDAVRATFAAIDEANVRRSKKISRGESDQIAPRRYTTPEE